jgi:hypothetical protein
MGKHQRRYSVWVYGPKGGKSYIEVTTIPANGIEDAEKKAINFCTVTGYKFYKVVETVKEPMMQ